MPQGNQVKNGKAFEYALANAYAVFVGDKGKNVSFVENDAFRQAMAYYNEFSDDEKAKFDVAANQTIDTMVRIEPGILAQKNDDDVLHIMLNSDSEGEDGDVRDVIMSRTKPSWEIGFSAKNNNDAVKHSRLSNVLDFGKKWVGVECSDTYWKEINPIFAYLKQAKAENKQWEELGDDKVEKVYKPLLAAFRKELLRINSLYPNIPSLLVQYLIGRYPFYKIIKDDSHNLVIVKAFNINGELNKTVNGVKSQYLTPCINLPTRIVEFEMRRGSDNTLNMILDEGWEISFRIHNASKKVETSLKFDIKLLGNPPVLFTQHLFR